MVSKEIKNINQNLIESNLSIIPLNILNVQGYSIVQEGNKAMFYNEDKFIKLALVKGIELDKYLVSFNVKKDIISLFEKMSIIEKKHGEKSSEVDEYQDYTTQLPLLYNELKKEHWVIENTSNISLLQNFVDNIKQEIKKIKIKF